MAEDQARPDCVERNGYSIPEEIAVERGRSRTKITCLVVFLLFVAIGITLLWRAVLAAREAARDIQCRCHMKQIALALYNYHQAYKCFPPAYVTDANGKPMHSWRVLILPFIEGDTDYKNYRFDEPWNSPNNLAIAKRNADRFCCPSQPDVDYPITNYVAIVGPHTVFDGVRCRKIEEITDGIGNTLLIVEVADSGICWNEPRDLRFDEIDFSINGKKRPGIGSHHPGKINASTCDSGGIQLYDTTPPEVVKALATIDGGEEVDVQENKAKYR